MEYQAFLNAVAEFVTAALPGDFFITVYPIHKNNNYIWDAFVVKGGDFSPTVYAMPYYERYKSGTSLSQIQAEIAKIFLEVCDSIKGQTKNFFHYEDIKARIAFRFVNYASNCQWLVGVPYRLFFDMAMVYYIVVFHPKNRLGSILITNQMQQTWQKTEAELYQIARRNTPHILPPVVNRLSTIMKQLQSCDQQESFSLNRCIEKREIEDREMYIVSNRLNFYGAACFYYPGIWKKIANWEKTDLAVTTLSVHELVAVPFQKQDTWEIFQETARRTYDTIPTPTERLTASVYRFSRQTETFSIV